MIFLPNFAATAQLKKNQMELWSHSDSELVGLSIFNRTQLSLFPFCVTQIIAQMQAKI